MKVLILMSGGFDTYGPSRHLYDSLIDDLLTAGNTVHLIESHSSGNDPDAPEKFIDNKLFSFETIKVRMAKKNDFLKRYLYGVLYAFKARKPLKKNKKKQFNLVLVQSCPWAPFTVYFAKRILKIPVVWNIQDMFPGSSIASGVMKRRLMQKFFFAFHKIAYKNADYITVISEDMKKKVESQGVETQKIHVILNWFDDQTVHEVAWKENRFVAKFNLDSKIFYVQYAGTMGFVFNYMLIVKVAEKLIDHKDILFHMIGFGSQLNLFKEACKESNLTNIVFLPLQPQDMVSDVYSACSICLIPLKQGVIGNSVPSKVGLLMACKKPIITTADNDSIYNHMINDQKIGFAFSVDDIDGVCKSILKLKENRALRETMGQNAFNYGKELYSRKTNTAKYIGLFKSIVEEKI